MRRGGFLHNHPERRTEEGDEHHPPPWRGFGPMVACSVSEERAAVLLGGRRRWTGPGPTNDADVSTRLRTILLATGKGP